LEIDLEGGVEGELKGLILFSPIGRVPPERFHHVETRMNKGVGGPEEVISNCSKRKCGLKYHNAPRMSTRVLIFCRALAQTLRAPGAFSTSGWGNSGEFGDVARRGLNVAARPRLYRAPPQVVGDKSGLGDRGLPLGIG
jgi:hypothetical protein